MKSIDPLDLEPIADDDLGGPTTDLILNRVDGWPVTARPRSRPTELRPADPYDRRETV